jgi:hypothetical protein
MPSYQKLQAPDREAMSLITPPVGPDGIATIAPNEPPAEV